MNAGLLNIKSASVRQFEVCADPNETGDLVHHTRRGGGGWEFGCPDPCIVVSLVVMTTTPLGTRWSIQP